MVPTGGERGRSTGLEQVFVDAVSDWGGSRALLLQHLVPRPCLRLKGVKRAKSKDLASIVARSVFGCNDLLLFSIWSLILIRVGRGQLLPPAIG